METAVVHFPWNVIPRGWAIFQKLRGPLLCQALTFELPGLAAAGGPKEDARVTRGSKQ